MKCSKAYCRIMDDGGGRGLQVLFAGEWRWYCAAHHGEGMEETCERMPVEVKNDQTP